MSFDLGNAGRNIQYTKRADSMQSDAAGNDRISIPYSYFSSVLHYHKNHHIWHEKITQVGGTTPTSVLMDYEPSVLMTCPSPGDEIIRQSPPWPYQAGNSQLAEITGLLDTSEGSESEMGYCDGENGLRVINRVDGNTYIELLSMVSGSLKIRRAAQVKDVITNLPDFVSEIWNIDSFTDRKDHPNPSKVKLDFANAQILIIDLLYLALGRARVGFQHSGVPYPAHQYVNDNKYSSPYMSRAMLPIRYRLKNVSSLVPVSMKAICSTVKSEGGSQIFGFSQVARSGDVIALSGVNTPVVSVRPQLSYQGRPFRGIIIPIEFKLIVFGNVSVEWQLIHGGVITGGAWTDIATGGNEMPSCSQQNITATSINTTGHTHDSAYASGDVKGSTHSGGETVTTSVMLWTGPDVTEQTPYTLTCAGIGGNATVRGTIKVGEVY
jgi:hypothetical protein